MMDDQKAQTNPIPEPGQFGLSTLFVLPVFVAIYFAAANLVGGCAAVILMIPVLLFVACFRRRTRIWAIPLFIAYLLVAGSLFFLFAMGEMSPEPYRRMHCNSNLKSIGIALHNYHDAYGSFPPAYITDDEGRPAHSWRVLILPFLEQQPLYDRYRFDEPWNGPNNIKLLEEMPSVFQCQSDRGEEKTCSTNYVAVIGPQTAWPGDTPVRFSDIADGTSNTWLVVEVAESGIAWSEPRDLHVLQMAPDINAPAGQGISSKHPGGAQVLYADGSVHFVFDASCPRQAVGSKGIRDLLTIDGGETVTSSW